MLASVAFNLYLTSVIMMNVGLGGLFVHGLGGHYVC